MVSESLIGKALKIIEANPILFQILAEKHGLTREGVMKGFIEYNSNVMEADNSIYDRLDIRAAMFIEYQIKNSWHQERQDELLEFLHESKPRSIIDVGFGAPTKYVKEYVLGADDINVTLADKFDSAFTFSKAVFESWQHHKDKNIQYKKVDINHAEYLGDFEMYIFQDSIEHSSIPTEFLSLQVQKSPPNAWFILSIPIAPIIPCHSICWENVNDANDWIQSCGLRIVKQKQIFVNESVDEFAKDLGEISDLMLLARRNE